MLRVAPRGAGRARPAQSEQTHDGAPIPRMEVHVVSRARVTAPPRSENPTPTRSCWRSLRSRPTTPPGSTDWPGLQRGADCGRVHRRRVLASCASTRPRAPTLPLAVVGTGAAPDAAALRDAVGAGDPHPDRVRDRSPSPRRSPTRRSGRRSPRAPTLGGYRFDGYKSEAPKARAARVIVHGVGRRRCRPSSRRSSAAADAVALVKDLVSIPAEWLGPADFAERATAVGRGPAGDGRGARRGRRCATAATAASSASGQGSDRPPRLVRLEYAPDGCHAPRRARRQGHHVRHRRTLAQARRLDGRHEVRHVRRRDGPRACCAPSRRIGAPVQGDRVAVHRRQHAVGPRDAARRRAAHARRHDRRGAQHRRRGPPRPRGRTRRREPRASRS